MKQGRGENMNKMLSTGSMMKMWNYAPSVRNPSTSSDGNTTAGFVVPFSVIRAVNSSFCHLPVSFSLSLPEGWTNEFLFTGKLTNPSYVPPVHSEERQRSIIQPERLGSAALHVLRRTGSTTSLTSLVDPGTGEGHIRVCVYCKQLLERRESQMDSGTQKCVLVELYDEMRRHMNTANLLIPTFLKMVDSLK